MAETIFTHTLRRFLPIVMVATIILSIALSGCTTNQNSTNTPQETLLTITVGSQTYNYTMDDLTALGTYTGQGSYINKKGTITGPYNYTGVTMSALLNSLPSVPANFTLHALASDNYSVNYSISDLNGHVALFNDTGAEMGMGNLIMLIAYEQDGVLLNETTKGPLRIAFVNSSPFLTNSGLWLSSLVRIEVI
jgi:hypothetical protein